MGYPHWPKVGTLDTAVVVRHGDKFNSARGPSYLKGGRRIQIQTVDSQCDSDDWSNANVS